MSYNKEIILNRLFPYINKEEMDKLQIDYESIGYITIPNDTKKINTIIKKHIKKDLNLCTIVDATGGVGGDTIAFSKYINNIISIELNEQRCLYLKNNIKIYKLTNISAINGNCIDIIPNVFDLSSDMNQYNL